MYVRPFHTSGRWAAWILTVHFVCVKKTPLSRRWSGFSPVATSSSGKPKSGTLTYKTSLYVPEYLWENRFAHVQRGRLRYDTLTRKRLQ